MSDIAPEGSLSDAENMNDDASDFDDFAEEESITVIEDDEETTASAHSNGSFATPNGDSVLWHLEALAGETPEYLIPRMDHEAVSTPLYYQQLILRDSAADVAGGEEIEAPLHPLDPIEDLVDPLVPVEGAILTLEQGWFEKGLALGRLLHSTCLAPGEVTKIAITNFERTARGSNIDSTTQADDVDSNTTQNSAVHETQRAVAEETQAGTSLKAGMATHAEAGVTGGGFLLAGNASTAVDGSMGVAHSSTSSTSDIAAEGSRRLNQNTVAASHAVRARRSVQIHESAEAEKQSVNSRVLANYNHMHALTMMFFEVLQVFELKAKVVHAERVIFVPMEVATFDDTIVRNNAGAIRNLFAEFGMAEQIKQLNMHLRGDYDELEAEMEKQASLLQVALEKYGYRGPEYEGPDYRGVPKVIQALAGGVAFAKRALEQAEAEAEVAGDDETFWDSVLMKDVHRNVVDPNFGHNLTFAEEGYADVNDPYGAYKEARREYQEATGFLDFLNDHKLKINQLLWMRLDDVHVQRLVAGKTFKGSALGHLMDPKPIGLHGNYVVFRLPHPTSRGDRSFARSYAMDGKNDKAPTASVVLPSGGVFGEAVLGSAVSAEKIDLTRFWNWKDSPIPILPPDISPVGMASRARGVDISAASMEASITKILEPALQEGVDLKGIVGELTKNFRDMSGSDDLGKLMAAQVAAAQAGAARAGTNSVTALKNNQDFGVGVLTQGVGLAKDAMTTGAEFGKELLKSDVVKAAMATAFPEGEAATVIGGLIGATAGGGGGGSAAEAAGEAVVGEAVPGDD